MKLDRVPARYGTSFLLLLLMLQLAGCGGHSSSSTATVATITVAPKTASITVNQQQTFTASAVDSSGNAVTNLAFLWASSAPNVATVTNHGVALGLNTGTAQITVSANGVTSAAATLTVTRPIASITISPTTATVAANQTRQFTATALDSSGTPISGVVFAWSSSFSGIATVDSNGLATGVAPGTVTIVASASGFISPPATLTVTP